MTAIDQLLARARLLDAPFVPSDVIPYEEAGCAADHGPASEPADREHEDRAASELQTLCETVLAHGTAACLQEFTTEHLPEPAGARVLACVLQLADDEDSARAWWQYAAGAGDDLAPYCLYLQHLKHGDTDAAAWWLAQSTITPDPEDDEATDISVVYDDSFPTVLRVLSQLDAAARPRSEVADAVMHYVPGAVAVGYLTDTEFDMPVPRPDFAEQLTILLAAASAAGSWPKTRRRGTAPALPGRRPRRRPIPGSDTR